MHWGEQTLPQIEHNKYVYNKYFDNVALLNIIIKKFTKILLLMKDIL